MGWTTKELWFSKASRLCLGLIKASIHCTPGGDFPGIQDGTGFEAWHIQEKMSRLALQSTHTPISWVVGVKQLWREADRSPLFVQRLRMIGGIPSLPHLAFMAWMGTNLPLLYLV